VALYAGDKKSGTLCPKQGLQQNTRSYPYLFHLSLTRQLHSHCLKMTEFSLPLSFEPTDPLKHDHTLQKAAILGIIRYLQDYHICVSKKERPFTISMFLNKLDFAGLERMNLAGFIIVQTQIQIPVVENKNSLAKIYK
jgi:hypothetical protein